MNKLVENLVQKKEQVEEYFCKLLKLIYITITEDVIKDTNKKISNCLNIGVLVEIY